jgi:uncharacterized membrane protein (UPF0127 family)
MLLINARTSRSVASNVEIADTRAAKRRGLMGRSSLPEGCAMLLTSCWAVHTIGMRFPIDVVFVDNDGRVRKIVRNLSPWRIAVARKARMVIEFAGCELDSGEVAVGDRLYLRAA